MTTNQTIDGVPRELLALLDATAETVDVHEVQWNSIHGPEGWKVVDAPEYHRCTGPLWDRRITRKPAAQPQGEPAFYRTKQPAPVAVALPARPRADEEEYERMTDYEKGLLHGGIELWDKIDEAIRLAAKSR